MTAYSASKGAIRTMTKAVAMECVSNNIRVNTIVPGAMQTPIQANVTAEADAWQRSKIPMGDLGEPDDIAFGALYLSSDEAKYVTGAELVIDGGWSVSARSEEHTSELQSLMRISYAVFCLKKKKT